LCAHKKSINIFMTFPLFSLMSLPDVHIALDGAQIFYLTVHCPAAWSMPIKLNASL